MKKRSRSLTRDVLRINTLQAELGMTKQVNADLQRELMMLRDHRTRAINALRIAGESLASRGALETARYCRYRADEMSPPDGCAMGTEERR